jgi:hypothetical protein
MSAISIASKCKQVRLTSSWHNCSRPNGDLTLLMHLIRLDDGTHLWTRRIARPANGSLDGLDLEAARMIESGVREHVLPASPNP